MVRSLWTGATGMIAQQLNLDNVAHNLSNVNTTGYKKEVMEFKSLLYQTIQTKTTTANVANKPVGAEVGLGTRNTAVTSIFTTGSFLETPGASNFAIDGDGFFGIRGTDGNTYYTRNGEFVFAIYGDDLMLTDKDGLPVLSTEGEPIIVDGDTKVNKITVGDGGELFYPDEDGNAQSLDVAIGLWQFNNPAGLNKVGNSMYQETEASGAPMNEADTDDLKKSTLVQGYLEGSNVQVADEMVNMIIAQRAYEMNSRVITTSDEMLQQANQLKR